MSLVWRFLQFEEDDSRYLEDILKQFRSFGCRVIPVASVREGFTRLSIMAGHSKATGSGLAVRIEFDDLDEYELLEALLESVRVLAPDCILLVDLTNAHVAEHDEFARFLVDAIIV